MTRNSTWFAGGGVLSSTITMGALSLSSSPTATTVYWYVLFKMAAPVGGMGLVVSPGGYPWMVALPEFTVT